MGYYLRIFGKSDPDIALSSIENELILRNLKANFLIGDEEKEDQWSLVNVANSDEDVFMQIERNPVISGQLGYNELQEFKEEVVNYRPKTASDWLVNFFNSVEVIYSFQLLINAYEEENFQIVHAVRAFIWNEIGGVLQQDNEGFTNEESYNILWQYNDDVSGIEYMAVLGGEGNWHRFKMDIGDKEQKMYFLEGKVPPTAELLE